MTENDVNPPIYNDPMEKRNKFIDHPLYICPVNIYVSKSQNYIYIYHFLLIIIIPFDFKFCHGNVFNPL